MLCLLLQNTVEVTSPNFILLLLSSLHDNIKPIHQTSFPEQCDKTRFDAVQSYGTVCSCITQLAQCYEISKETHKSVSKQHQN